MASSKIAELQPKTGKKNPAARDMLGGMAVPSPSVDRKLPRASKSAFHSDVSDDQAADYHEQAEEEHHTLARHYLAKKKPSLAEKHRDAAAVHMTAAAYYRKASRYSYSKPEYAKNYRDLGDDSCNEAHSYEDDNDVHRS